MNAELKENAGLPAHILWTLAIVAGISVANLYYNQPLLNLMRADLGVSDFQANLGSFFSDGCLFHDSPNICSHRFPILPP